MKQSSKLFKFVGLLLVVGLLFAALPTGQAQAATTITVCAGISCDYTTIQAAINVAVTGDTINVAAGTYAEQVVVSGKTNLTIQGVGDTTLIKPAYVISTAGITVMNSNNLTIQDLKIQTAGEEQQGIWVKGGTSDPTYLAVTGLTVHDVTIVANGGSDSLPASGITADSANNAAHSGWTITDNSITASGCAIAIQDVTASTISGNTLTVLPPNFGANVLWTSERHNLANLVFSDNIVSGSGGSQVAVITDFNQVGGGIVPGESPVLETTITGVTFHGNTFSNWGSKAIKVGDAAGTTPGTVTGIIIEYNTFQMTTDTEVIGGTDALSATGTGNIFNLNGTAVNYYAPVAVDDAYVTPYYTTLSIIAPGVLENDTDLDGDTKTATLVTDVSHGTLSLYSDGSFEYTPAPGFAGTDTFVYQLVTYPAMLSQVDEWTDEALVTITVTPAPYIYYFPLIFK